MTDQPNLTLAVELAGAHLLFDVRHFDVLAEMSRPFEVELLVLNEDPTLDLEALVGSSASFVVAPARIDVARLLTEDAVDVENARVWRGIIREIEQLATEPDGASTYAVQLVPHMWLLTQRTNNSIFQFQSEVEIVRDIFDAWQIPLHLDARELERGGVDLDSHRRREYRTQYEETDFDFTNRMLEEAGIAYYFDASADNRADMVLSDAPHAGPRRAKPLSYQPEPGAYGGKEWATHVRLARRVAPGKVSLVDHDFRRPPLHSILAEASTGKELEQRLDVFEYRDGHFLYIGGDAGDPEDPADANHVARTDLGEGQILARKRLRAQRARAREITFRTNVHDVDVGHVLRIDGHPRQALADAGLLVTRLRFTGAANAEWLVEVTGVDPREAYHPPLRTPRPVASGVESATVVGRAGEEIDVDKHGRVKVYFHWDRDGKPDEHSSCWMHPSQPWGGAGFGGSMLPRIGQEVLVAFLGSDPDRPIIVGRYYTSLQKTPLKLPQCKDATIIRTNSLGGGGGANEICMRDTQNGEKFLTTAERDRADLTKRNRASTIRNDENKAVGNNRIESIGCMWNVTVGQSTMIRSPKFRVASEITNIYAGEAMFIYAGFKQTQVVGEERTIAKNLFEVADEKIGMKAGQEIRLAAPKITLVAGASTIVLSDAGIALKGPRIDLN